HPFLAAIREKLLDAQIGKGRDDFDGYMQGTIADPEVLRELEEHPNIASVEIEENVATVDFEGVSERGLPVVSYRTLIYCECGNMFEQVIVGATIAEVQAGFGHSIDAAERYWDTASVWYEVDQGERIEAAEFDGKTSIYVFRGA
ncbi:MAG: hypothetical protein AAGC81_20215, partial [Pseudomonadota bacterium]